jgi:hypothetical protein
MLNVAVGFPDVPMRVVVANVGEAKGCVAALELLAILDGALLEIGVPGAGGDGTNGDTPGRLGNGTLGGAGGEPGGGRPPKTEELDGEGGLGGCPKGAVVVPGVMGGTVLTWVGGTLLLSQCVVPLMTE